MRDARLRELETRWLASGSHEDEAAWLGLRFQNDDVDRVALEVAAYFGHAPALDVLPDTPQFPDELDERVTRWGRTLGASLALGAGKAYLESIEDEVRSDWEARLGPVLADLEACATGLAPAESQAAKNAIYHSSGSAGPLKTLHHAVIRFDWLLPKEVAELRRREEVLGIVQPKAMNGSRDLCQSLRSLSKRVGPSFLERVRAEVVARGLRPEPQEEEKAKETEGAILRRARQGGGRDLLERILAGELSQAAVMLAALLGDPQAREAVSAGGGEVPKRPVSMDFSSLERFDADFTSWACLRTTLAFAELPRVAALRGEDPAALRALAAARACFESPTEDALKEAREAARQAKKAATKRKQVDEGVGMAIKAAAQAAACAAANTCKAAKSALRSARLAARDVVLQVSYAGQSPRHAKQWAATAIDDLVAATVIAWALAPPAGSANSAS